MPSTIILSDNGASSGSAGLKQTAGNDGVLILQTTTSGGTATNAVYVDTSQNVGIGTSSPNIYSTSNATNMLGIQASGTNQNGLIAVAATGTGYGGIEFGNSTIRRSGIYALDGSNLAFYTNGSNSGASLTERARILSTGGVQFNAGISVGGTAPASEGSGVKFPATQVASTDVNTLDDYEEGTWTPVFTGGGVSVSYSEQVGRYVKIGKMVYISCRIVTNSSSGGSGNLKVGGLPFASVNAGSNPGFMSINFSYNWASTAILNLIPVANATTLDAYTQYAASPGNTQVPVSALTSSTSVYLIFGGCYEAAA